jgi:hypothetical protein
MIESLRNKKAWVKIGELQSKPCTILSYVGEGEFEVKDDIGIKRRCYLTDMEII